MRSRKNLARALRLTGMVVFVVAFLLPAVDPFSQAGRGFWVHFWEHAKPDTMYGWECARLTFMAIPALLGFTSSEMPALSAAELLVSGLLNPITLAIFFMGLGHRWPRVRKALTYAVALCLLDTWWVFASSHIFPQIGHVLWALGALMIAAPEWLKND